MNKLSNPSVAAGHFAMFLSVTIVSSGFMVQKLLLDVLTAPTILLIQFSCASLILWAICLKNECLPKIDQTTLKILAWGITAPGGVMIFALLGASKTDGISLALTWGTLPLIVPLMGWVILKEKLHWSLVLGALIGFGGLIILTQNRQSEALGSLSGNLLVLMSVLLASSSQIIGRFMHRSGRPMLQIASLQVSGAWFAVLMLFLFSVFQTSEIEFLKSSLVGKHFIAFAYLILMMTVLNYILFNLAVKQLPVAWVSIYVALNPVVGTLAAIFILGESARIEDWAGMAVIVSGVMLPHLYALRTKYNANT